MLTLNDLTTDSDVLRAEYHVLADAYQRADELRRRVLRVRMTALEAELRRIEGEGWLGLPETE